MSTNSYFEFGKICVGISDILLLPNDPYTTSQLKDLFKIFPTLILCFYIYLNIKMRNIAKQIYRLFFFFAIVIITFFQSLLD